MPSPKTTPPTKTAPKARNKPSKGSIQDRALQKAAVKAAAKKTGLVVKQPATPKPVRVMTPGEQALAWLHTARFLTTAAQLHQLPESVTPEVAFVGRSNAGKSTCINTLAQQKQLAYASKTPGRTQHINLFEVGKQGAVDLVLADLPGYGYAAVNKESKARWQQVMANYLVSRQNLRAIVVLADSRHGLTELDESLLDIIRERVSSGLEFVVLLTKADKLTRSEQNKTLSIARLQTGGGDAMLFSATHRLGVEELALKIKAWAAGEQPVSASK
jgi:GTP-binding protein